MFPRWGTDGDHPGRPGGLKTLFFDKTMLSHMCWRRMSGDNTFKHFQTMKVKFLKVLDLINIANLTLNLVRNNIYIFFGERENCPGNIESSEQGIQDVKHLNGRH